jgi:isopropylmalate/homocitrate/citramalate synthase
MQLGLELSRLDLDRVYREMIALADRQKTVEDADLTAIVDRMYAQQSSGVTTQVD